VDTDDTRAPADAAERFAAERFAAAVEGRPVPGGPDDPQLARELVIAQRLTAQGRGFDPEPEARERARQRLMAALAERSSAGPSRAS
jgi:hypothetical protein